jgi:hypothetical protein
MMLYREDILVLEGAFSDERGNRDGIFLVPFIPTAENIAGMILTALKTGVCSDIPWSKVQLYETPTSMVEVKVTE